MGLKEGKAGLPEEGCSKRAEWILPDQGQNGFPETAFCSGKESLPFGAVLFEQFLPAIESPDRDLKTLTDLFHRAKMKGVFCQNSQDEEEAVTVVGNDGIRQDRMCGQRPAAIAGQSADKQVDFADMTIHEFDQGTAVVRMDAQVSPAAAVRTGLRSRDQMGQMIPDDYFAGPFFTNKVAFDQVLSYHNNASRSMSRNGVIPVQDIALCLEEERILGEMWVLPPLLLSGNQYRGDRASWARKKRAAKSGTLKEADIGNSDFNSL